MNLFEIVFNFSENVDLNQLLSRFNGNAINAGFVNQISTPTLWAYTKEDIKKIVISPQRYLYRVEQSFDNKDLESFSGDIEKTIKVFQENIENSTYTLKYVSVVEQEFDTFEKTKKLNVFSEIQEQIIATGFRYFFEFNDSLCELKAEPFLKDSKNLFFEGIYNGRQYSTKEGIMNFIKSSMGNFEKNINGFIDII